MENSCRSSIDVMSEVMLACRSALSCRPQWSSAMTSSATARQQPCRSPYIVAIAAQQ